MQSFKSLAGVAVAEQYDYLNQLLHEKRHRDLNNEILRN